MGRGLAAVLVVLGAACSLGRHASDLAPGSAPERLPVLLVVESTAVDRDDAARIAATLSRRLGRPVLTAAEPSLDEATERARLTATHGRLPSGGWAEPRCAAGRAAAHALHYDADAYYHLRLERSDSSRRATVEEQAAVSGARRASATVLDKLGVDSARAVRAARLTGTLTVMTFGISPETRQLPLRATAQETATIGRVALDPEPVVAEATAKLAPPPYPHWDATARRELAAGCRVTALAIYDARLRARPGSRDVLARALGRGGARPRPRPAAPVEPPVATPAPPDTRYSCRSLCELHMVEMCNNDRDLWSRHQMLWQSTPCGQRRDEPFLRDCYQRQWLSGTFDEACRVPCEGAPEGRARLLHLLQAGGCARTANL